MRFELSRFWERTFASISLDVGTGMVTAVFIEELVVRMRGFSSHRIFMNAVLGLGNGTSVMLLVSLTLAQLCACVVLVTPELYLKLGAEAPSMALALTLVFELVLYQGFRDVEIMIKSAFTLVALYLVALLRVDRKMRASALHTPLLAGALSAEARLRELCTRARGALLFSATAGALLLRALFVDFYFFKSGSSFEILRTRFYAKVALAAVFTFLSGLDRSETVRHELAERAQRLKEDILARHRSLATRASPLARALARRLAPPKRRGAKKAL